MKRFAYILIHILLFSCSDNVCVTSNRKVIVGDFDNTYELVGEKVDIIQSIGFYGCEIKYPYLILSLYNQNHFLSVYNIKNGRYLGDYFKKGDAPHEYLDFNILNQELDSIILIDDPQRKKLNSYTLSFKNDSLEFKKKNIINYDKVYGDVYTLFINSDSSVWTKIYDIDNKSLYYTNSTTKNIINPFCHEFEIDDLNRIMTLADGINEHGTKIASLTGVLDQVEIIDLLNSKNNISAVISENTLTWNDFRKKNIDEIKEYFLSQPRCNEKYIIALHNNNDYEKELLLIDWEGNGIAKLKLKEDLIDFDIDWEQNIIYGITEDEEVYKYNIDIKL